MTRLPLSALEALRPLRLLLALGALLTLGSPPALTQAQTQAITLDAASSEVDYRSNTVLFRDLSITQGSTRVTAERARSTGLDFEDSTWMLTGDVRIEVAGGELRADSANVIFKENKIIGATIEGGPAQFSQALARGGTARGEAGQMVYELDKQTVTLRGKSWLTDGRNEIRGEQLVYNLQAQRVQAGTQTGSRDRVQIIIRPTVKPPEPRDSP